MIVFQRLAMGTTIESYVKDVSNLIIISKKALKTSQQLQQFFFTKAGCYEKFQSTQH